MFILVKDNIIFAKSPIAKIVHNGIALDGYVFGVPTDDTGKFCEALPDIVEVQESDIPTDFVHGKYKYVNGKFLINTDYIETKSIEQLFKEQQLKIELMQEALNELILGGM